MYIDLQNLALMIGLSIILGTLFFRLMLKLAMRKGHDKLSHFLASFFCLPPFAIGVSLVAYAI